eukprot:598059-Amorphochlora_amoeboformis.AAC.1
MKKTNLSCLSFCQVDDLIAHLMERRRRSRALAGSAHQGFEGRNRTDCGAEEAQDEFGLVPL